MSGDVRRSSKFPLRLDELGARIRVASTPKPPAPNVAAAPKLRATAVAAGAMLPPQRLVDHVHVEAARRVAPGGLGLDSADVRRRMAERLRKVGVNRAQVIDAMATVPRHLFVDAALVTQAYEDTSLPIGHGQTISKPSVVARMIELLLDGANARRSNGLGCVLEIGTGCGYQAAVLALLAKQVISIERL